MTLTTAMETTHQETSAKTVNAEMAAIATSGELNTATGPESLQITASLTEVVMMNTSNAMPAPPNGENDQNCLCTVELKSIQKLQTNGPGEKIYTHTLEFKQRTDKPTTLI